MQKKNSNPKSALNYNMNVLAQKKTLPPLSVEPWENRE